MESAASRKRKSDSEEENPSKRVKVTSQTARTADPRPKPGTSAAAKPMTDNARADKDKPSAPAKEPEKRVKIHKLAPKRPFPTVPTSVSATGPRSAHKEGKNCICITRKTKLAAYMRRCKNVVMKDGYKTLHLSAMGAAIPLLLQLTVALPPILPFAKEEIKLDVTTATVEVQDEVIPEDEDEDISYQTRSKSALHVTIKIGDGEYEGSKSGGKSAKRKPGAGRFAGSRESGNSKPSGSSSRQVVLQEPEQDEEMEML